MHQGLNIGEPDFLFEPSRHSHGGGEDATIGIFAVIVTESAGHETTHNCNGNLRQSRNCCTNALPDAILLLHSISLSMVDCWMIE